MIFQLEEIYNLFVIIIIFKFVSGNYSRQAGIRFNQFDGVSKNTN